ncbi:hypothetical protein [Geotalea sp. SG265]|uniref:hypothetical protein n=1 Tax=Geotalea sp. SG265 TaxID=2922867 RepID=UPI001FAF4BD1|nr:hypothetical protein [Geotalea sp. SG265]
MLSQKDYEGFQAVIRDSAYLSSNFEISTIDYVDRFERIYPDYTRVFIRHTPTNVTGKYIAGCAAYWLHMLEHDIGRGVY